MMPWTRTSLVVETFFITRDSALMNSKRRPTAIRGEGYIDSASSPMPQYAGDIGMGAVGDADIKHRDLLALIQKHGTYLGERRIPEA